MAGVLAELAGSERDIVKAGQVASRRFDAAALQIDLRHGCARLARLRSGSRPGLEAERDEQRCVGFDTIELPRKHSPARYAPKAAQRQARIFLSARPVRLVMA